MPDDRFDNFENMSVASDYGVMIIDTYGQVLFESSVSAAMADFFRGLYAVQGSEQSCRVALLYGCYQARRFGGRYVFFAPSGLLYCASVLLDEKGGLASGVLAGPFIMTDYDDFIEYELAGESRADAGALDEVIRKISVVPCRTPKQIRAVSENLYFICAAHSLQSQAQPQADMAMTGSVPTQTDFLFTAYPIDKEDELLAAISKRDIHTADAALHEIIKQMVFHYGGNLEALRTRVVELTTLLSRAAIKGNADANAILGLNYDYLKEIDNFSSLEDIVLWLQTVTRRFTQQVFDFSGAKHMSFIYKAVDYIKRNYAGKITLKDIADHLYISQSYLSRIFKDETGQTPVGYITSVRIEESKKLLRRASVNMIDIPDLVGFESQSYFTKIFKRSEGCTPGIYRRRNLETN